MPSFNQGGQLILLLQSGRLTGFPPSIKDQLWGDLSAEMILRTLPRIICIKLGESLRYIGKVEGDFINNIICIYKKFGESFILLYNVVKFWRIFHFII